MAGAGPSSIKAHSATASRALIILRPLGGREQRLYGSDSILRSSLGPNVSTWQEEKAETNRQVLERLSKNLPATFPPAALARALSRSFIPPTPRRAIDSYWRAHPIRADRLARALAALKRADPYGRALKLITEFRYFECGTNTETLRGRGYSIFGACPTFSSSIVTSTQRNAPSRRGIVVPHAPLDLNRPNR